MSDNNAAKGCGACVLISGILLTVILVPLSFSYVEYYEYGLNQRKTTGSVDLSRVYDAGRYSTGPDHHFIKYQADAHYEEFNELSVFSAGGSNESIGLEFVIDVDLTFFLIEDEVALVHKELATNYRNIIVSRAKDAIKNEAIFVTFTEYFQARKTVESRFAEAVQARWKEEPSMHCTLDQFHVGRIRIPETVAQKQLEATLQNERNDREQFLQQAKIEREKTAVDVNAINLEKEKVLRTAEAEASLLRSKAKSEADKIRAEAQVNGTRILFNSADIVTQEHMTSFTYIRALRNRDDMTLDVSYLSPDNIVRTRGV